MRPHALAAYRPAISRLRPYLAGEGPLAQVREARTGRDRLGAGTGGRPAPDGSWPGHTVAGPTNCAQWLTKLAVVVSIIPVSVTVCFPGDSPGSDGSIM
jgi:hypothetical protein